MSSQSLVSRAAAAPSCGCGGECTDAAHKGPSSRWSRRGFLATSAAGAAGLLAGLGVELSATSPALAQTSLSPEAALQEMLDGNRRFVEGRMTSFNEDLALLKRKTVEKQQPFAALLSCVDSRVPVELVFDQSIGRLFVARVAGNIATPELVASLEYGVAVLGTKAIMVLGHANCGAVQAAIAAKPVPGQISALYQYLRPAVDQAGSDLAAAIKANARIQAALLREASPVIAAHIAQKQLEVVAAYYDLASGKVSLLS
ncbi:MAG TPA: carbonic anhydrase [Alphaproteobacteria bacterium]|nr:carbonic anhydrase [Alphaproteobacteria bacterium]